MTLVCIVISRNEVYTNLQPEFAEVSSFTCFTFSVGKYEKQRGWVERLLAPQLLERELR